MRIHVVASDPHPTAGQDRKRFLRVECHPFISLSTSVRQPIRWCHIHNAKQDVRREVRQARSKP